MKKKKLKLPFLELADEFYHIISVDELRSIVGGLSYSWDTDEGFLGNVNEMIEAGLFDYYGDEGLDTGYVSLGDSGSGSGSGLPSFSLLNYSGSSNNLYINFNSSGSSSTQFSFGSMTGGSVVPLNINFGTGTASFTNIGGTNPLLKFSLPNGKSFSVGYAGGQIRVGIGVNIGL